MRTRLFVLVLAVSLASQPLSAAPAEATGQWHLRYTPTSCDAQRRFGDQVVVLTPSPMGNTTRVLFEVPGKGFEPRQYPASLDPQDGGKKVDATALLFTIKGREGFRGIYTVLPSSEVDRMLASGKVDFTVGKPREGRSDTNSLKTARVTLALGSTGKLRAALDTCMKDLRNSWGMVDGKLPTPAVASRAVGDVRGIFRASDYPIDAFNNGQSGTAQFLLMIGEDGKVMDCTAVQSSGVASFDAMGCQVLRERARFTPARDAAGKPAKDSYITPPIRWKMY